MCSSRNAGTTTLTVIELKIVTVGQPPSVRRGNDLRLDRWTGDVWDTQQIFMGLAGDSWNKRPAIAGSMLRLANLQDTPNGWEVNEIRWFSDTKCKTNLPHGEPIASGTDVPAASTVTPMIAGWMFHMQPSLDAHVTIKYESTPIQMMEAKKVSRYLKDGRGREKRQ